MRIDRLARSLSHLLEVIERLEAKNAFFRSLTDPIDTSSPQGKFTLQVLGAAAEFERALIRERTKAGLAIVAAIKGADPEITLQAICTRLEAMRERTPGGRTSWQPSSVKMLLERAERLGLLA